MRNAGPTEIAALGVTPFQDPFCVTDFVIVKQEASGAFVEFDDHALAQFQGEMVFNQQIMPDQCRRIWAHTHPSWSASPSGTDWTTFEEHFENMDWSIMFIMGRGRPYSKDQYKGVPDITAVLRVRTVASAHEESHQHPIHIDTDMSVAVWTNEKREAWLGLEDLTPEELASLPIKAWQDEYTANVKVKVHRPQTGYYGSHPSDLVPHVGRRPEYVQYAGIIATLDIPWTKVQERYGLNDAEIDSIKTLDPEKMEKTMEDLELSLLIDEDERATKGNEAVPTENGAMYHGE